MRTAVTYVGLGVAVALTVSGCTSPPTEASKPVATAGQEPASYLTGKWRLVSIDQPGQNPLEVPADRKAGLEFGPDHTLGLEDGVNHLGSRYQPTAEGFVADEKSYTTLVGYAGSDATVLTMIKAIGIIVGMSPPNSTPPTIRTTHTDDQLVLQAPPYVLNFRR
jgi:heat shock protein HslJ